MPGMKHSCVCWKDWKPDQPIKRDNSLIDPLEESYSQKAPQRHAGGYSGRGLVSFQQLAEYSSRVFYPKRPTGWLGDKDLIDFQTMVDRICRQAGRLGSMIKGSGRDNPSLRAPMEQG